MRSQITVKNRPDGGFISARFYTQVALIVYWGPKYNHNGQWQLENVEANFNFTYHDSFFVI